MFLILGLLFLLSPVHSRERPGFPEPDALLIPELERLTKILSREFVYPQFYNDFHTEAVRHNISVASYANTCFDSYLALKLSPAEEEIRKELRGISGGRPLNANITEMDDNFQDAFPITYSVFTSRRDALNRFAARGMNETAQFVKRTLADIEEALIEIIADARNVFTPTASKIALGYKKLSAEIKIDLENNLCLRNNIKWLNATVARYTFDSMFRKFTDVLGLNIDQLLENSPFLLSLKSDEVKEIYEKRAEDLNMTPQEYVDVCTELMVAYEQVKGFPWKSRWGKDVFNTTREMEIAYNGGPNNILGRKFDAVKFVKGKLQLLSPKTRSVLNLPQIEKELDKAFLDANNLRAEGSKDKIQIFSDETIANLNASKRELEQLLCVQGVWETAVERKVPEINFNITV